MGSTVSPQSRSERVAGAEKKGSSGRNPVETGPRGTVTTLPVTGQELRHPENQGVGTTLPATGQEEL